MKLAGIACAGLLLLTGGAAAQDGGKATTRTAGTRISLGTATPGGGFPVYGNAFAEVMNAADPALSIEPRNTTGSSENIPLLESGQLDIALVAGEPCYEAFLGIGRPATKLKILTAMYSSPGMFVVRADSPYKTIQDLVGQPVAFGARGSGLPIPFQGGGHPGARAKRANLRCAIAHLSSLVRPGMAATQSFLY